MIYELDDIIERLRHAYGVSNDSQLARAMRLSNSSVIQGWRARSKVPMSRIEQAEYEKGINKNWIISGKGEAKAFCKEMWPGVDALIANSETEESETQTLLGLSKEQLLEKYIALEKAHHEALDLIAMIKKLIDNLERSGFSLKLR